jgi:RNA polymerase sigma factor (sigma-70 family)
MADERLNTLVRHLRRAVAPPEAVGLRDGQLLERFLKDRDEAAFELLLWRHGPMVLGTCRRLLRHAADVDDAFQATFLVLLRKARTIGRREALGAWLYRVAYRVALRARAAAARRARHERPGLEAAEVPAPPAAAWDDLRPVLDEEVSRLPARERSAFVLCCLQGKTHAEAGRELGCPEGTVSWRVARARQRLRGRLARRGLALSAAALAGLVSANATAAPVPAALVSAALRAALLGGGAKAAAAGAVSAPAAALTEGVLQAMLLTKVKGVAAVVLALALVGGGGALTYRAAAGPAKGGPTARLAARAADADEAARKVEALTRENAELKARLRRLEAQLAEDQATLKAALAKSRAEADYRSEEAERFKKLLNNKPAPMPPKKRKRVEEEEEAPGPAKRKVARVEEEEAKAGANATKDDGGRAAAAQKAQDEVELLQAQLRIKQAELAAAKAIAEGAAAQDARAKALVARNAMSEGDYMKSRTEATAALAQVRVKEAELMAAEVSLKQAMRRLEGGPGAAAAPGGREQRLKELDAKLDALRKEIQSLRQGAGPNKP